MFTNIVPRLPDSTHDSFIFSSSLIGQRFEPQPRTLEDGLLLGDIGYPCKPYLMTPYLNPTSVKLMRKHSTRLIKLQGWPLNKPLDGGSNYGNLFLAVEWRFFHLSFISWTEWIGNLKRWEIWFSCSFLHFKFFHLTFCHFAFFTGPAIHANFSRYFFLEAGGRKTR